MWYFLCPNCWGLDIQWNNSGIVKNGSKGKCNNCTRILEVVDGAVIDVLVQEAIAHRHVIRYPNEHMIITEDI